MKYIDIQLRSTSKQLRPTGSFAKFSLDLKCVPVAYTEDKLQRSDHESDPRMETGVAYIEMQRRRPSHRGNLDKRSFVNRSVLSY